MPYFSLVNWLPSSYCKSTLPQMGRVHLSGVIMTSTHKLHTVLFLSFSWNDFCWVESKGAFKTIRLRLGVWDDFKIKGIEPSKDTLETLQSDVVVKDEFKTTLRNKNCHTKSNFLVIQGMMDSLTYLLNLEYWKLIQCNTQRHQWTLDQGSEAINTSRQYWSSHCDKCKEVFQGIGHFWDKMFQDILIFLEPLY